MAEEKTTTTPKVVHYKVGKIDLEVQPDKAKEFVPPLHTIVGNEHELETIALGARDNLPVLLIGDTGTGKTSFIRFLAHHTKNGFRRLNLNGSTTADELVGHYVVKEKTMVWVDGVLLDAMKNGYWLLLDELNAGLAEVLFVLQSVLDDDKFLVVAEHEGEIVTCHPDFRIFATMNPSLEYAGTRDLNKALLSRFPIVLQTQYPDAAHEIEIIKTHVPTTTDKDASVMVRVAEDIRKGKKNGSIGFICSTRELINWAKLTQSVGLQPAAELAILNKCELDTDKKTVEDIFKMMFGRLASKQVMTLTDIETQLAELTKKAKTIESGDATKDKQIKEQERLLKEKDVVLASQTEELNSYRKVLGMAAEKASLGGANISS